MLDDDDEGIVIAKSGAPEPSDDLKSWLDRECHGAWQSWCDGAFNVFFEFEKADDALLFAERWHARPATT